MIDQHVEQLAGGNGSESTHGTVIHSYPLAVRAGHDEQPLAVFPACAQQLQFLTPHDIRWIGLAHTRQEHQCDVGELEFVQDRGDRLRVGQIVLTGSIPSLIPIREDSRVRVDAPPFGSVDLMFIT